MPRILPPAIAISAVAAFILLTACTATPASDDDRIVVVGTVSPITNLIDNVGGGMIELTGLVPEGVNSHTFEPTPSDARILSRADLIFANGLNLELPTLELARANTKEGSKIVELGAEIISENEWIYDFSFPKEQGDPNPHLWTNPAYAISFVEVIANELAQADSENASAYRENSEELIERIDSLDRAIREATATVPEPDRKLLTYHDSFPYFAREYGWTVIGAIQPSDFSEPTAREVAGLIDQIRNEGVKTIFGSEVFPSEILEQIAKETGVRYVDELRDDDLPGAPSADDHSYVGLMRFNLVTIVEALGGDAGSLKTIDASNLGKTDAEYR